MFPVEMTMPFTLEEEAELNRLVRLERESVQILPVKIQTAAGIFESMQVSPTTTTVFFYFPTHGFTIIWSI